MILKKHKNANQNDDLGCVWGLNFKLWNGSKNSELGIV